MTAPVTLVSLNGGPDWTLLAPSMQLDLSQ